VSTKIHLPACTVVKSRDCQGGVEWSGVEGFSRSGSEREFATDVRCLGKWRAVIGQRCQEKDGEEVEGISEIREERERRER